MFDKSISWYCVFQLNVLTFIYFFYLFVIPASNVLHFFVTCFLSTLLLCWLIYLAWPKWGCMILQLICGDTQLHFNFMSLTLLQDMLSPDKPITAHVSAKFELRSKKKNCVNKCWPPDAACLSSLSSCQRTLQTYKSWSVGEVWAWLTPFIANGLQCEPIEHRSPNGQFFGLWRFSVKVLLSFVPFSEHVLQSSALVTADLTRCSTILTNCGLALCSQFFTSYHLCYIHLKDYNCKCMLMKVSLYLKSRDKLVIESSRR